MKVKPQRSTLLTVLCILTFVGSAYGIISAVIGLASASKVESFQAEMDRAKAEMKEDFKKDSTKNKNDKEAEKLAGKIFDEAAPMITKEGLQKQSYISIGACILTLIGALLMFQLKLPGFGVYVAGKLIEISAPLLLFGAGLVTGIQTALTAFIGLIFIVLYAFCIKEMRPAREEMDIQ